MKKRITLITLVTLTFNLLMCGMAVSAEEAYIPKDPGNIYEDLTGNYGLLGIAGQFHVFAKDKTIVNAHTDGNIATSELDAKDNFGTELHEGFLNQEINYIQKTDSFINSSGIPTGDTRVNKFVVGSSINVALQEGRPAVNGARIDHLTPDDFYQDRDGSNYIDFEKEFARLNVAANDLANGTPTKTYRVADFPDMNHRTIDLTGLSDAGFLLVNIDAEVFAMNTPLQIINPSNQVAVFNVTGNSSTLNIQSPIKYNDRTNHETEDFTDANLSWNFGNDLTDLTISAPFQGTILAPNADVRITQNQDGTIIGKNVVLDAATNRWDPNEIFMSNGTDPTSTSDSTGTTATSESTDSTATSESTETTVTSESTEPTSTSDSTGTTATSESTDSTATSESTDPTATSDSTGTTVTSESTDSTITSDSTGTTVTSESTEPTVTSESTDSTATSESTGTTVTSESTEPTATSDSTGTTVTSDSTEPTSTSRSTEFPATMDGSIGTTTTSTSTNSESSSTTTTSSSSITVPTTMGESVASIYGSTDATTISDSSQRTFLASEPNPDNSRNGTVTNRTNDSQANKSSKVLPETGSVSDKWMIATGSLLLLFGIGWILISYKKVRK
ncbi:MULTISPECIES: collagen-binding domain-containing protein [unclassified Enterococcus]|uniref:collagen-binding domain-containing protein n=1 Tax=unclassified Enterococcus TaxID=2608891 RepID=UPI0013EC72A1|nr:MULTISPECIES: collagen-binding domain-containing protein [unclassified Enterococcus]